MSLGLIMKCFQEPIYFRRGLFFCEAVAFLHASDKNIALTGNHLNVAVG